MNYKKKKLRGMGKYTNHNMKLYRIEKKNKKKRRRRERDREEIYKHVATKKKKKEKEKKAVEEGVIIIKKLMEKLNEFLMFATFGVLNCYRRFIKVLKTT
jgi:hypothetical protein